MDTTGRIRSAGIILIAASLLWIVAILIEYGFDLQPPGSGTLYYINQAMFLVAMAGWVTGIFGLMRARAAGGGWFSRIALGLFGFGWITLIVAGLLALITGNNDLPLFPIGGLASMLGGLLAGVAVAVAGRWHGWRRFSVLFYGLFYFLVLMLPLMVANREPTLITEVLWGLAWLPIGAALVSSARVERPQPAFGV
ncbi:MAG TPA: hypothetical protein VGW38_02745 [Chloroflexota bacterium]|nr:hypothetical protein [Chloroflexota bacterium]